MPALMLTRTRSRAAWALLLVAAGLIAGGCGGQAQMLGLSGQYLLSGRDVLALPGEQVTLRVRLLGGVLLSDQEGYLVRFLLEGRLLAVAQTDDEGYAAVTFTPPAVGDYRILAQPVPWYFPTDQVPPESHLLVQCRPHDVPVVVVDLDKTLVASDFRQVLLGNAQPMADAPAVMGRLAGDAAIVYLTWRPDIMGPASKQWLARHGFPDGVVVLADTRQLLRGSEQFKGSHLRWLGRRYSRLRVGIGDRISDMHVYRQAGMRGVLILSLPQPPDRGQLERLARQIDELGDGIDVVDDWRQVEQALFDGRRFPPADAAARVRELAGRLPQSQPQGAEDSP